MRAIRTHRCLGDLGKLSGPIAILALLCALLSAGPAGAAGVITVCPEGPPTCDYGAIQPGLDAAAEGDTVLVYPGSYPGRLTLRSGVTLAARDGPAATVITATAGPIVSAAGAAPVTVQGFTVSGGDGETGRAGEGVSAAETAGFDLADSEVTLTGCVIRDLRGADGSSTAPDGADAAGIRVTGTGSLTVTDCVVEGVRGGDGLPDVEGGALGGSAAGLWAAGPVRVTITGGAVRQIGGGAAGTDVYWPYGCDGGGGAATGISAQGGVDLSVTGADLADIAGGAPCRAWAGYCIGRAGAATGIWAAGSRVSLRDNTLHGLVTQASHEGAAARGIYTTGCSEVRLEGNRIAAVAASEGLTGSSGAADLDAGAQDAPGSAPWGEGQAPGAGQAPSSPCCSPPAGRAVAVESAADSALWATDNSITGITGCGYGGEAVGIRVLDTSQAIVVRNRVTEIAGSGPGLSAAGCWIEGAAEARIEANAIGPIRGGTVPLFCYWNGADGGDAAGIVLRRDPKATGQHQIANNVVRSVMGGPATSGTWSIWGLLKGGDAVAASMAGGTPLGQGAASDFAGTAFFNNTLYGTAGGPGGTTVGPGDTSETGPAGAAIGLRLLDGAAVLGFNNALVGHGVAISITYGTSVVLDYNAFWANGADHPGVSAGPYDVHAPPGMVDPSAGNVHLLFSSPLIDAGANAGAPPDDFEGDPRPLDGDGDGIPRADIGADEYRPGAQQLRYLPLLVR